MKCNKIFNGWSIDRKNIGNIDIVNLHISHITTQRIKVEFLIFAVCAKMSRMFSISIVISLWIEISARLESLVSLIVEHRQGRRGGQGEMPNEILKIFSYFLKYFNYKLIRKFNKLNVKIFRHFLNLFFQNYSNMSIFFA